MNKKFNFILKKKKVNKFFLYLLVFFIISFFIYFLIPKFFNYTPSLIQASLNKNNNIIIKNISDINYKLFPSPRIRLSGTSLIFGDGILDVQAAEVDIVLNLLSITDHKIVNYNKLLINKGSVIIEITRINQLFNYIKKNKKKINLKKNNIILLKENKKLLEINDVKARINTKSNIQQLNINGFFLNHKISFILKSISDIKTKIILKVPDLDVLMNILLETNDDYKTYKGLVNIELINNFFQFDLVKKEKIIINKGFVRSNLINSSLEGDLAFKPYFSFNLDIKPTAINTEKLVFMFQQLYLLENLSEVEIIKKLDGTINFKNIFKGSIIFKNREILFKNFNLGENSNIVFDSKISDFGKKGKIRFYLTTNIQDKENFVKELKISGYLTPSSSRVIFDQIILDKETFTDKKIKNYQAKFKNLTSNSLNNIFNETKIRNFLENF